MLLGERSYESVIKPLGWRSSLLRAAAGAVIRSGTPPLSGLRRMDPNICAFFAYLKDDLTAGLGGVFSRLPRSQAR